MAIDMAIRNSPVAKTYSIAEAKNLLGRLVHLAEAGEQIRLTRRGRPVAVVVGAEEMNRLVSGRRGFWEAYQSFRKNHDLASLKIDPNDVFGSTADRSPGRDFSW